MAIELTNWGNQEIPYSQEAEEAVLGAILVNPIAYYGVSTFLEGADFFILRHKYIWDAFTRIVARGDPVDYLILVAELKDANKLGDIGGPAYITNLINATPTSIHVEAYGHLVERAATRRRLMAFADEARAAALNSESNLEEVLAKIENDLMEIATFRQRVQEVMTIQDMMSETWDFIEERQNSESHISGLTTGFDQLDKVLSGLQAALYILGGRPGMGKSVFLTALAINVAKYLAKRNAELKPHKPEVVLSFNMEMTRRQIALRMLGAETGIPVGDILAGHMHKKGWDALTSKMGSLSQLPFLIYPGWKVKPSTIRGLIKKLSRRYTVRLVIVDYIQRMKADEKTQSRVQEIGSISRGLVEISGEFGIPVFVAAQLSRDVEHRKNKRPLLDDLKESGDLEQDAHAVLFLYRDDYYTGDLFSPLSDLECIIAKNREGPTGMLPFVFNRQVSSIEESDGIPPPAQAKVLANVTGDLEDD